MKSIQDFLEELKSTKQDLRQEAMYGIYQYCVSNKEQAYIIIPVLQTVLDDSDWVVRKFAVMTLGILEVCKEIPRISKILNEDNEPEVRVGAADALGNMKAVNAIDSLTLALNDTYDMLRKSAAWALGQIGIEAKRAVPKLIEILNEPETGQIAQTYQIAAWALGEIGDKSAIEPLYKKLNNVIYHDEKFTIAYSLTQLEGLEGEGYSTIIQMKERNELKEDELKTVDNLVKELKNRNFISKPEK